MATNFQVEILGVLLAIMAILFVVSRRQLNRAKTYSRELELTLASQTAELKHSHLKAMTAHIRLRSVLNNLDALIYVSDIETYEVMFANAKLQEEFGDVEGSLCWQALQNDQTGPCEFCTNDKLLDEKGYPTGVYRWQFQNSRNKRWYAVTDSALEWFDGRMVRLSMSTDITALKVAEQKLLEQQRVMTILEERERIGRELYDSLGGQILGYLNIQAQAAKALLADNKQTATKQVLEDITEVTQQAHKEIREFILGIKKTGTLPMSLWDTLRAYTQEFERNYGIRVVLSIPQDTAPLLPPIEELRLLRIIQEGLTNVRKHAQADQIQIIFSQIGKQAQFIIADNGAGFNTGAVDENHQQQQLSHTGLTIMREYAAVLGGALEIRSGMKQGTQLIIQFPISAPDTREKESSGTTPISQMRLVLVDDHTMFLEGLHNLLTAYGLKVVGLGSNASEAQQLADTLKPDVIIMDLHMPGGEGLEATRAIKDKHPETKIIILTVSDKEEDMLAALKAGATGYLLKNMNGEDFYMVLNNLDQGIPPIAPELAGRILAEFQQQTQTAELLDLQQQNVLKLVAQGLTYREVAQELYVSERTVKRYMKEILEKLQLKSRAEAVEYAQRRGITGELKSTRT